MKRSSHASRIILVLCFLCALSTPLFANGQTEDLLKQAQVLMNAKEYNKALLLLEEIGLRDKERLDEVQLCINLCMEHVGSVNELKQKILDALDRSNDEAAIALMDHLKALDPKELDFLGDAYEVKKLKIAYKKFQEIMDAAYALVVRAQYQEALDAYREGFTLYREEFLANPAYDKADVSNVQSLYIEIDALVAEFSAKSAVAEKSAQAVADLFTEGRQTEGLARAETALRDLGALLDLRWRLIGAGRRFQSQNEYFKKKSPDGKGDNLFYFSQHTVLGREGGTAPGREGMYYAAEARWEALLDKTEELFRANAERLYGLARESERAGNPNQADPQYGQAEKFAARGAEYLAQYLDSGAPTAPRRLDARDRKYLLEKYPRYAYLAEIEVESRRSRTFTGLQKQYEALNRRAAIPGNEAALKKNREEAKDRIAVLEAEGAALEKRRRDAQRYADEGFDMAETARLLPEIVARCAALLSAYQKLDRGFAAKLVDGELQPARDAYADGEKRLAAVSAVRDGTEGASPRSGEKHPSDALKLYEALKKDLERGNPAERFLEKWNKESRVVREDPAVKRFVDEAGALSANFAALEERLAAETDRARAMRDEAKEYYNRAAAEYQRANQELAKKTYQEASRQLALSKKDATDSRANEETEEARQLLAAIAETERKIKVASVDARIAESNDSRDRGIERYFLQDFESAQVLLERAKNLLIQLASQESGEVAVPDTSDIQLWLDLVLKAIASAPVRLINQKDPLYAEITARQTQAEESYQAGLDSQKKGNDAEAQRRFQDALDQIQQIQKTFPQLKESGVLLVKVLIAQKGEAWFKSYVEELVQNAERKELKQAVAELEDALALAPDNQRLKQALERVRAKLYVKPVVSAQAKAEAESLYAQAAGLIRPASATRSDWGEALKLVNRSLVLDPYSGKAKELQTRILKVIYRR